MMVMLASRTTFSIFFAQAFGRLAALVQENAERSTAGAHRRPHEHLRCAVVADHLRLDMGRIEAEKPSEMNAKAHGPEKGTGSENACLYARGCGGLAHEIGQRIGRVCDNEQHGVRGRAYNARNDVAINRGVLVEEP